FSSESWPIQSRIMLTCASRWRRKYGSRCAMLTRLRLSSMPQLPPRAAMRTPFTLMTMSVLGQPPSTGRMEGDASAPGSSECTQGYLKKSRNWLGNLVHAGENCRRLVDDAADA